MCGNNCVEHCGVVGIFCKGNAVGKTGQALIHLQQRGKGRVGLSVRKRKGNIAGGHRFRLG